MTFAELQLLMAIRRTTREGRELVTDRDRLEFAMTVATNWAEMTGDVLFPFDVNRVVALYLQLRKNGDTKRKADVAIRFGTRCFWDGRGKGPCCETAELGHIIARAHGGLDEEANLMIECRSHNNQRRERSIEEYLAGEWSTVSNRDDPDVM